MVLTVNNDPTRPLTGQDVRILAACDDVRTYTECGWFCVMGYRGGRREVHAHAKGADDFVAIVAGQGFAWTGCQVVEMTPAQRRAASAYAKDRYRGNDPYRGKGR